MNSESDVGWKLNYIEKVLSSERPGVSSGKTEWTVAIPRRELSSPSTTGWGQLNLAQDADLSFVIGDAIEELRTATELLKNRELQTESAMVPFRAALQAAVSAYEQAEAGKMPVCTRISNLSVALAMARSVLKEEVATLSAWTAVQACTRPNVQEFKIPGRFLKRREGFVGITGPSEAEVRAILDLTTIT